MSRMRTIYQVQDSLDRATQATTNMCEFYTQEMEFRKEVYALKAANQFHLIDDCCVLMQAKLMTLHTCQMCEERRERENAEWNQHELGFR